MVRVVKEYEERKNELLDIAQRLFCQRGYANTSVSAIIKEAGVAKGTFYHYFKSKEELIDALACRVSERILKVINSAIDDSDENAIEKFNTLCRISARWKAEHKDMLIVLISAMYSQENLRLRNSITKRIFDDVAPLFEKIIVQGVEEGLFDTPSPKDAANLIMIISVGIREQTAPLLVQLKDDFTLVYRVKELIDFYTDAIERLLGAPRNSIDMGANEFFSRIQSAMAGQVEGKGKVDEST